MNIYVISNDNDKRRLIKVGETNDEWEKRERAYRTSGYVPHLWHFEYDVDFKDDDIKRILVNDLAYTVCKNHGDEWYELKDAETENDFTKKS